MKKPTALIWAAWLTHAVAWFLPVIGEGTTFPHGLPGWQAFRVAAGAVWPYRDVEFEHWYHAVLATLSATATLLFILGSVWVVWFGSRRVRRVSAWIAASAFVINAHWCVFVFLGPDPKDLKIGYFLWWLSFLLLAWGLFGSIAASRDLGPERGNRPTGYWEESLRFLDKSDAITSDECHSKSINHSLTTGGL